MRGEREIEKISYEFLDRASSSKLLIATDSRVPNDTEAAIGFVKKMLDQNPRFEFRIIADIQNTNVNYYSALFELGVNIRHIEGNRLAFALSDKEYITAELSVMEEQLRTGSQLPQEIIWSTRQDVIVQFNHMFEMMWKMSSDGPTRVKQLKEGVEPPRIEVVTNPLEIEKKYHELVGSASKQVELLFPTTSAFKREIAIGIIDLLEKKRDSKRVKVRILSPIDSEIEERAKIGGWALSFSLNDSSNPESRNITIRRIDPARTATKVTIVTVDQSSSFVIELRDDSQTEFQKAIGLGTFSTSTSTVGSYSAIFEKLWHETELRESESRARRELAEALSREEKSRRQAELLQDILTHDIRNYNQVSRLSAELLEEKLRPDDEEGKRISKNLILAIDGSTALVEKARRLGRILGEEAAELHPTDLLESIRRSMALVKHSYPEKTIVDSVSFSDGSVPYVVADELLDEVFTNIYSNSVKYSDEKRALIDTRVVPGNQYWKVSVSDRGVGVPDSIKEKIFARYIAGAKGTGLGMSIIHALVVGRYKGKVWVSDNFGGGDTPRGTVVEVLLPKASKSDASSEGI